MSGARLYLVLGTWKKETENKELLIYYHRTLSSLQPMVPSPRVSSVRAVTGESLEHWSTIEHCASVTLSASRGSHFSSVQE